MTKKQTNKETTNAKSFNADEREQIIFHRDYDPKFYEQDGTASFDGLPVPSLIALIEKGYLRSDDITNNHTVQKYIDFAKKHHPEKWVFHGRVVSPDRPDRRVIIDGIESNGESLTKNDIADFLHAFMTS